MPTIPTADPDVFIEEQSPGYVRYQRTSDGRRWEVYGTCIRLGNCIVGATIDIDGQLVYIRDHAHIAELNVAGKGARLGSAMDTPITPEFDGCCSFTFVELAPLGN